MAGFEAGHIAMLMLAWQLTGSASHAAMVILASVVARTLGAPVTGWIGDRYDRRRVMICGELAAAASFGALALAQTIPQLLLAVLVGTLAISTAGAAIEASVPNLVPDGQLVEANSTLLMARTAGHMLGPVLGGVLVAAAGARAAFLLDAATSVLAALLIWQIRGMRGATDEVVEHGEREMRGGMLAGIHVIAADRALCLLAASWACMCVGFALVTAAELPLADEFGVGSTGFGAIVTSWCAGSLVGSWLARRMRIEQQGAIVLARNAATCGLVFACTGLVPAFWLVLALMAVGGASMAMADVIDATMVQQRVEDEVRARVNTAFGALMSAVFGAHLALGGLVVDTWSPGTAYVIAGSWMLVAVVGFALLARHLKREQLQLQLRILRPRHALEEQLVEGA